MRDIRKVAVLGAGTMGARIAAHLANASIPARLLDIVPKELTHEEQAKGLTLNNRKVRNRFALAGLDAALKSRPAAFFLPDLARMITVGNFEDDLAGVKDCDWIIEAVTEDRAIKRALFEKVQALRAPDRRSARILPGSPSPPSAKDSARTFAATSWARISSTRPVT